MNLLQQIESDLTAAMKSGDSVRSGTLKMVKSDMMYEKAKTGEDLNDEQMLEVVTRAAKRRRESIEEYRRGNREDLAEQEAAELVIIEAYLPEQMSDEDIEKAVSEKIAEMGEVTQKDFGRVMGVLMKDLKGKADGKAVKSALTKALEGK